MEWTNEDRLAELRERVQRARNASHDADCRGDVFNADLIWCEVERLEEQLFWLEREGAA